MKGPWFAEFYTRKDDKWQLVFQAKQLYSEDRLMTFARMHGIAKSFCRKHNYAGYRIVRIVDNKRQYLSPAICTP